MSIDTHKAVKTLTGAGFSETQAEALIETMGDSRDVLATKADMQELAHMTSADMQELARATKADMQELAQTTKADIAAVRADFKTELKDLELRLEQRLNRQTIQLAGLAIAAGGVVVAILKWFP